MAGETTNPGSGRQYTDLRIGALIQSTNDSNQYNFYLSGRHFSTVGKAKFQQRVISHPVQSVTVPTTEYVPIMTFRKKTDRKPVPISVQAFSIDSDNTIYVRWFVNVSLGDATNWITPDGHQSSETALEVNEDATTVDLTNAVKLNGYRVLSTSPQRRILSNEANVTDVPDEYNISLVAKAESTEATVTAIGKMIEER